MYMFYSCSNCFPLHPCPPPLPSPLATLQKGTCVLKDFTSEALGREARTMTVHPQASKEGWWRMKEQTLGTLSQG